MRAVESYTFIDIGASGTFSPIAGSSHFVRPFPSGKKAWIIAAHFMTDIANVPTAQVFLQIQSANWHDFTSQYAWEHVYGVNQVNLVNPGSPIPVVSGQRWDAITSFHSAGAGDPYLLVTIYYEDIEDYESNLISFSEYKRRLKMPVASGYHAFASASDYGTPLGISTVHPVGQGGVPWKDESDYAILGAATRYNLTFVGFRGNSVNTMRMAQPSLDDSGSTQGYWGKLSKDFDDLPVIPVFPGSDMNNTVQECICTTNIPSMQTFCGELEKKKKDDGAR